MTGAADAGERLVELEKVRDSLLLQLEMLLFDLRRDFPGRFKIEDIEKEVRSQRMLAKDEELSALHREIGDAQRSSSKLKSSAAAAITELNKQLAAVQGLEAKTDRAIRERDAASAALVAVRAELQEAQQTALAEARESEAQAGALQAKLGTALRLHSEEQARGMALQAELELGRGRSESEGAKSREQLTQLAEEMATQAFALKQARAELKRQQATQTDMQKDWHHSKETLTQEIGVLRAGERELAELVGILQQDLSQSEGRIATREAELAALRGELDSARHAGEDLEAARAEAARAQALDARLKSLEAEFSQEIESYRKGLEEERRITRAAKRDLEMAEKQAAEEVALAQEAGEAAKAELLQVEAQAADEILAERASNVAARGILEANLRTLKAAQEEDLRAERDALNEAEAQLDKAKGVREQELQRFEVHESKLRLDLEAAQATIAESQTKLERTLAAETKYRALSSKLSVARRADAVKLKELRDRGSELESTRERQGELEGDVERLRGRLLEAEALNAQRSSALKTELAQLKERDRGLQVELANAVAELTAARQSEASTRRKFAELKRQKEEAEGALQVGEGTREALSFVQEQLSGAGELHAVTKRELEALRQTTQELQSKLAASAASPKDFELEAKLEKLRGSNERLIRDKAKLQTERRRRLAKLEELQRKLASQEPRVSRPAEPSEVLPPPQRKPATTTKRNVLPVDRRYPHRR